jgi:glycosyltransferase involved in cell wall biosynthesis
MKRMIAEVPTKRNKGCRFLFVGTQFDIKGGVALLRAFRRVYAAEPTAELRVITHLPPEYASIVEQCPGIIIHEAHFRREEIFEHFMQDADVLVHPSYMESFGMAVLEAIAHGLAVVGTDMYALREMIEDGVNGALLTPPISIWDGFLPSRYYSDSPRFKEYVQRADTSLFEEQLAAAMLQLAQSPEILLKARQASLKLFAQKFERMPTRVASERL